MNKWIGYFGEEGSFAHLAATRRFTNDPKIEFSSCPTMEAAFSRLADGTFLACVVPIENASRGTITDTVDELIRAHRGDGPIPVVRECLALPVKLVLLAAAPGIVPKVIYSHEAALTHASSWLVRHYPGTWLKAVKSTSAAAQLARAEPDAAALAGEQAISLYGLAVLRDDVEAEIANRTKFYILSQPLGVLPDPQPATHTSLFFEAAHRPGSLVAALEVLSGLGLNLTMIQSRPIPGRFDEYRFFIEFEGVPGTPKGDAALAGLKAATHSLNLLGSYPIVTL